MVHRFDSLPTQGLLSLFTFASWLCCCSWRTAWLLKCHWVVSNWVFALGKMMIREAIGFEHVRTLETTPYSVFGFLVSSCEFCFWQKLAPRHWAFHVIGPWWQRDILDLGFSVAWNCRRCDETEPFEVGSWSHINSLTARIVGSGEDDQRCLRAHHCSSLR